jgi:3-hydroxyisobutyrate dehydrogenase-like beta-hydroxyacid dehydrogenase
MTKIAIIGFGEVGSIFARDLFARGVERLVAYDIQPDAASGRFAQALYVTAAPSAPEAVADADLVIVAVTAGSVMPAMLSLGALPGRPLVLDVNSISPGTKQRAAALVEGQGGRYVEAAVMSSVPPKGLGTAMLLGGPHAADFMTLAAAWDMRLENFSARIGAASSVKMCRSVMIKGLEALTLECLLSARRYGVEEHVLASLGDTLPHENWPRLARYVMSRALIHGRRRAEEMHEVALSVEDIGLEPLLSRAIAARQQWACERGGAMGADTALEELGPLLDALDRADGSFGSGQGTRKVS